MYYRSTDEVWLVRARAVLKQIAKDDYDTDTRTVLAQARPNVYINFNNRRYVNSRRYGCSLIVCCQ